MGIIYIISECIGASIGYGLLALLSPNELFCLGSVNGMCLTLINESFTVTQGFFIEFFATSTLVAVVCAIWDKRTPDDGAAVKIGLTVFTLSYAFGVQTGASVCTLFKVITRERRGAWYARKFKYGQFEIIVIHNIMCLMFQS